MLSENVSGANRRLSPIADDRASTNRLNAWASLATFFDRYLIYWLIPVVILVTWQLVVQLGFVPARILPAPFSIVTAAIKMALSGQLSADIAVSTGRALSGLLVGGSIGFTLGLLNALSPLSEKLLDTTVQMIRTIPVLALVPLVILWFGIGDEARLFLTSLGVFFTMYVNTFHGVRQVDPGLIEMGRTYGVSGRQMFWHVIFPGALPSILLGLRLALGIMWLTLIVAETIAADSGIGQMALQAREFVRTDVMMFSVILYALLGKLADVIARGLERHLLQWHPRYQRTAVVAASET